MPSSSARFTIIVLTLGMSMPDSMMVEHTFILNLPLDEVDQGPLQLPRVHLSVADGDGRLPGTSSRSRVAMASMLATRLSDENDRAATRPRCPPESSRLVEPGQSGQ